MTRNPHPFVYPRLLTISLKTIEKTTPPTEEPPTQRPVTRARFLSLGTKIEERERWKEVRDGRETEVGDEKRDSQPLLR